MEDLVSNEITKKLIEKGFPILYYTNSKMERKPFDPTIYEALKWLREEYSIHISTKPYPCEDGLMWLYEIRKFSKYISAVVANKTGFIKEEQASVAGIEYVLDNLI